MSITGFNRRRRELAERERQSEAGATKRQTLEKKSVAELRKEAAAAKIAGYSTMRKAELIEALKG